MSTNFFTYNVQNTLIQEHTRAFESSGDIEFFDSLVGQFTASVYFKVRTYLQYFPIITLITGINVDKIITKFHSKGLFYQCDATQTINESIKRVINNFIIFLKDKGPDEIKRYTGEFLAEKTENGAIGISSRIGFQRSGALLNELELHYTDIILEDLNNSESREKSVKHKLITAEKKSYIEELGNSAQKE